MKSSTRKTFYLLSILALGLAIFAGRPALTARAETAPPAGTEVKIDNFSFTPATLTVPVGAQVTWTNHDDIPHNVVTEDKTIKSKTLDTDDKFSFTFTKPGTYSYFCSIHPKMTGKIIVQ